MTRAEELALRVAEDMGKRVVAGKTKACRLLSEQKSEGGYKSIAPATRAIQLGMYLAAVNAEVSHTTVSKYFNRDRSTVSHHLNTLEDLRDVKAFDVALEALEQKYIQRLAIMHIINTGKGLEMKT